ncbi:MAG: hypothetical protein ACXVEF_20710 [Polyangiales bacterium]
MRTTDLGVMVCLVAVAAASLAHAEPSELEKANARKLFNEGLDLRKVGDHKGALEKLEAADAIFATPKGRLELARERQFNNKLVEAYAAYLSVANIQVSPKDEAKYASHRAEATKLAAELEPRIPTLKVTVEGVPSGKSPMVQVDGAYVPNAALAEPRMVNPGKHVVTARVDNGPLATGEVQLKEGEKRVVVLTIATQPAPASSTPEPAGSAAPAPTSFESKPPPTPLPEKELPPPKDTGDTQRYIAVASGGLGIAGLALGTYFGLSAQSKAHDADPYCPTSTTCTNAQGVTLRHDAIGKANLATVVVIGGAVLLGAGVVLWITAPRAASESKPQTALILGPGSIGLRSNF